VTARACAHCVAFARLIVAARACAGHRTLDVYVDNVKVDAFGDFLDEGGSKYSFTLPGGLPADVLVTPIKGRSLSARLLVGGELVVDDESTGAE
jgi:hypothetical protein